ncbi:MAG: putative beta-lysine N-acetyltransferase [Syntrophomonadaceae bacterium]
MKAVPYNREEDYQYMNGTLVLWDRRNSRAKIIAGQLLDPDLLSQVKNRAAQAGVGKIISFALPANQEVFANDGFVVEGTIPRFFRGEDAVCCSFFVDSQRSIPTPVSPIDFYANKASKTRLSENNMGRLYTVRDAGEADIASMIRLFRYVFQSYPSPIFEPEYILHNMRSQSVLYKLALHNGQVIGIASAEMDQTNLNAEMTDCVTHPQYRNRGILGVLLNELEDALERNGYMCLYTLCRASNPAVNMSFARRDYKYSGCLINNCHICGAYEDMNILIKLINQ